MKEVILTLFSLILLTDAKNLAVDLEDSSLPGEVQQPPIKSKVAVRSANRNTRNSDDSTCSCQSGVVTYVRWGHFECPPGADMIYSGKTAGSHYDSYGSTVDPLCLPDNPQYLLNQTGYQGYVKLYGAEYQMHSSSPINQADNRNVPCALCQVNGRTSKIMIPSRYECPDGWTREYYGYLMAGHYNHKASSQFTCVDESFQQILGSATFNGGYLFYTVEAYCNHFIPCSENELTCAVCTK